MSDHTEKLEKLETKARKLMLKGQMCEAIQNITSGSVITGEMVTGTPEPQNLEDKVVHATIRVGLDRLPCEGLECLPFVLVTNECVQQF